MTGAVYLVGFRTTPAAMPAPELSRAAKQLRRAFDQDARLTKHAAAALLGCTARHVTRLVAELRAAGVPVEEERIGREKAFFVPTEHQCRAIQIEGLDEVALRALVVAARASHALLHGTPLEPALDRAFNTLLAAFGDDDVVTFEPDGEGDFWHFDPVAPLAQNLETLRLLDQALHEHRTVVVDYVNGRGERSKDRKLDPLAFAPFKSGWQLAAWCHRRREVRNFSPARMERVRLIKGKAGLFTEPVGFDAAVHFGNRFGALEGHGRVRTVRLRVAAAVAQHFRSKRYHGTQQAELQPGGDLFVTYQVRELDAMRAFVRSWGPNVVALEPDELVTALAEDARAMAAAYAGEAAP
jgi:predicted DNA-binding transcriptional regulator YafY